MPAIYVDGDACPVKAEALRVAERHGLVLYLVGNSWLRLGDSPLIRRIVVPREADAADNWIAEQIDTGDIVITADIPLAQRALASGAFALGPSGKAFTQENIGMAIAVRGLKAELRESGAIRDHNPGFTAKDRSRFLQALEVTVQKALKAGIS